LSFQPKSILNAEYTPVSLADARALVDAAYSAHPATEQFVNQGSAMPRTYVENFWKLCAENLDPSNSNVEEKEIGCSSVIGDMYAIYLGTGYEDFYDAALGVFRYGLTEFQGVYQQQFRDTLKGT
jgi:hypothetical protein